MEQIMCGMLARSKAGHDAKTLYLVCRTEGDFVYLCDGRLRKFDSPKKKNRFCRAGSKTLCAAIRLISQFLDDRIDTVTGLW